MSLDITDDSRPLMLTPADETWREHASCKGMHPSLFHPTRGEIEVQRQALAICNGRPARRGKGKTKPCPVRAECLAYAIAMPPSVDLSGIYGGMTHRERVTVRRRNANPNRQPPQCGTTSGYNYHRHNGERPCDACKTAEKERRANKENNNEA